MKPNQTIRRALVPVGALLAIGVGVAFTFTWAIASLVIGGLVWLDLSLPRKRANN